MARRRFTININVDEIGDIDKLIRTLRAWRPDVVVLMNGFMNDKYKRIRAVIKEWNAIVIYRHYEESDGHLWRSRTVDEHIRLLTGFAAQDADVWWYVSNEPLPGDNERALMQKWHADLIDKAVPQNLRLCVGNLAVAAMGDKKDIDGGRWDVFLSAVGKYADRKINGYCQILLGVHTYAHAVLPMHCAGRDPRDLIDPKKVSKDKWPSALEVYSTPEDNWLIFREDWQVARIKALTEKVVQVAVTEGVGWDRMPHIIKDYPGIAKTLDDMAGREVRGLPTVMELFRKLFPNWTPEQAACEQMAWVESVYPDNYICFALFTWSQNPQWRLGYDISTLDKFLELWPTYTATVTTTPPPAQPVTTAPAADSPLWYESRLTHTYNDRVNIRAEASSTSAVIGTFQQSEPGRTVKVVYTPYVPNDTPYMPIWFDNTRGWIHEAFLVFSDPPMPLVNDPRWQDYKAFAPGVSVPVYDWSNIYARKLVPLLVGGVAVGHIPADKLTPMEAAYIKDWHIVKLGDVIGYLQPDVRMDAVKPPPPPTDTVTIPKAEYDGMKEQLAKRLEDIRLLAQRVSEQNVIVEKFNTVKRLLTEPTQEEILQ